MSSSIVCADLGFAWPDGEVVFDGFSVAIGEGRTGLIGLNGSGKSTLLRLIMRRTAADHAARSACPANSATCRKT